MYDFTIYEVGGAIRDELLGVRSKDRDFAVEIKRAFGSAPISVEDGFRAMRTFLDREGYEVFLETPQFLTMRARFPRKHPNRANLTADFVLCRQDGNYTDGRHPDSVRVGTIFDDLARRDFTVNAMARDPENHLLDPHGGLLDLNEKLLRCVGDAHARLAEDALRGLRALRFSLTREFIIDMDILTVMSTVEFMQLLAGISIERVKDELDKMFRHNTSDAVELFGRTSPEFRASIFRDGLHLESCLRSH